MFKISKDPLTSVYLIFIINESKANIMKNELMIIYLICFHFPFQKGKIERHNVEFV